MRDAIMSGVYLSGQKLVVEDLAKRLGVSTTPVREALVTLAQEGLLEIGPRRGARVARLSRRDVDDIFLVYAFIAGVVAERAVDLVDDAVIDRLKRIVKKVDALTARGDTPAIRARIEFLNFSFHRTINTLVEAPRLHAFLRAASQYVPQHLYESLPAWTSLTVLDHPGIIEVLERRDGRAARRRLEEHVTHAGKCIMDNLEARGFWAPPG